MFAEFAEFQCAPQGASCFSGGSPGMCLVRVHGISLKAAKRAAKAYHLRVDLDRCKGIVTRYIDVSAETLP